MDTSEMFKLDCICGETIKIPVPSVRNGVGNCPVCGARLTMDWGALAAENPVTKPADVRPFEHPAIVLRRAYERELGRIEQVYGSAVGRRAARKLASS